MCARLRDRTRTLCVFGANEDEGAVECFRGKRGCRFWIQRNCVTIELDPTEMATCSLRTVLRQPDLLIFVPVIAEAFALYSSFLTSCLLDQLPSLKERGASNWQGDPTSLLRPLHYYFPIV